MYSKIIFFHIIFFVVFYIQTDGSSNQVDAAPKHAPQLASWFSSLEQLDFQPDMQMTPPTTEYLVAPHSHKKLRKKKIVKRKKEKERAESDKQEIKKKKKHKKKDERRFVKTIVRDRDFNASSSIESEDRRKPVDIIVHIKMHD